jgi:hypothetical protein
LRRNGFSPILKLRRSGPFLEPNGGVRLYIPHPPDMNALTPAATAIPPPSLRDEFQQVQTLIARRADELSQSGPKGQAHDLEYWLQAEQEVLGLDPNCPSPDSVCPSPLSI